MNDKIIEEEAKRLFPYAARRRIFIAGAKFGQTLKDEPFESHNFKEEYDEACKEIRSLYDQLKDAENEIRQLQNELRNP